MEAPKDESSESQSLRASRPLGAPLLGGEPHRPRLPDDAELWRATPERTGENGRSTPLGEDSASSAGCVSAPGEIAPGEAGEDGTAEGAKDAARSSDARSCT